MTLLKCYLRMLLTIENKINQVLSFLKNVVKYSVLGQGTLILFSDTIPDTLVRQEEINKRPNPKLIRTLRVGILEPQLPKISQYRNRSVCQTAEGIVSNTNNANVVKNRNPPTISLVRNAPIKRNYGTSNGGRIYFGVPKQWNMGHVTLLPAFRS